MNEENAAQPLAGTRIVAVEQFGAGPWATLQLADLGAEVIKIEDPTGGGDVGRYVPPYQTGEDSLFFETFNRNKQSVALDLRTAAGRIVLRDLAAASDAVFSNLRGDVPQRLGLTFDQLRDCNPRIVCCSLTGFGMTGPRAAQGGYDYVVQGLAGWMSLTGEPGQAPAKTGLSLVDLSAGYVAAIALLAGITRARRDGVGCDCDVSLFETALAELAYVGTWVATAGYEPERHGRSAHPSIVPFQNFPTADGWIVISAPKQRLWERLCEVIGRDDLLADTRFSGFAERHANRKELVEALDETLRTRSTVDWLAVLGEVGVPAAPVNDVAAALDDPQVAARGGVVSVSHPELGVVRQIATPLRLSGVEPPVERAPRMGEHTASVLQRVCGYDDARIAQLVSEGIVHSTATGAEASETPAPQIA